MTYSEKLSKALLQGLVLSLLGFLATPVMATPILTEVRVASKTAGGCVPGDTVLCLQDNRFQVEVERVGAQGPGPARVVQEADNNESGLFWFFSADNWEMLLKVLDGCGINGNYWVFAATASTVEWTLTVTDTQTGAVQQYSNPAGVASPTVADVGAFATCP